MSSSVTWPFSSCNNRCVARVLRYASFIHGSPLPRLFSVLTIQGHEYELKRSPFFSCLSNVLLRCVWLVPVSNLCRWSDGHSSCCFQLSHRLQNSFLPSTHITYAVEAASRRYITYKFISSLHRNVFDFTLFCCCSTVGRNKLSDSYEYKTILKFNSSFSL